MPARNWSPVPKPARPVDSAFVYIRSQSPQEIGFFLPGNTDGTACSSPISCEPRSTNCRKPIENPVDSTDVSGVTSPHLKMNYQGVKMNSATDVLAGIFRVNNALIERSLEGIDAKDLTVRPEGRTNSFQFLLGHITTYRYSVSRMLAGELTCPFGDLFIRGTQPLAASEYPEVREIIPTFREISVELQNRLTLASDELLAQELPRKFPNGENTVLGGVSFYALHDSYHAGQLGYLRKLLGYDQLVG